MFDRLLLMGSLLVGLCADAAPVGAEQPRVDVVVGVDAPRLEQFAARELAAQFTRLFEAKVTTATTVPRDAKRVVLIGSPGTNPAVKRAVGNDWPRVSDQGLVLRSFQRNGGSGLVVGGGSPKATLWAVYELGYRFGIRYLLREDIFPLRKVPPKLDGFDVIEEPVMRTRTWRTINDFPIGPESWGLADHQRELRQLAKMKFNRVMLSVWPWQPFVHYEFRGVKKQTAMLWFGEKYPVDGETVGKKVFHGAKFFENPDFAGMTSYEELTAAGIKHARGIIETAHQLGMEIGFSISPLEFPREFAAVLPGSKVARQLKSLTITAGRQQRPDDPLLKELVAARIRAYLKTYPSMDVLYLTLPEFPEWGEHAEAAWKQLDDKRGLAGHSLENLIETASKRKLIASGERGVRSLKGNVAVLAFFNSLFEDSSLLKRPDGGRVELVITGIDPALFPVLDRVVPEGAATLNFIDYTARRIVENREILNRVPAKKVRSRLILTLADDNVGVLSQSANRRLGTLMKDLREKGWDGFSTRYWIPGELDPTVHFLSRAAWDPQATPRSAHDDFWLGLTGNQAAADRMWKGWEHLEEATELIDRNHLGFAFPVRGMFMKHYRAEPVPEWWKEVNDHYTQLTIELYRVNGAIDSRARSLTFYYAKRGEYVTYYLAAVQAVRKAAIARKNGKTDEALAELEKAVESLNDAIGAVADVARDQSDRGLIAVLNEYAFRPLVAEYERMLDMAESAP